MSLPTRKIGDADVTAIGWGAMGLSAWYGPVPSDEERFKILDAVYESGCRFWDTSDIYGDSEDLLGKWFKRTGKRSEVFLATKFGFVMDDKTNLAIGLNGSPEYVREAIDKSLKRLGVDYIDLWYLHRPDPNTPIEVTVGAMAEAVKAGKVKYLGISEASASTLRRAHAVHPIAAVQYEYAPFTLDIEDPKIGIFQVAKELGIALVAYSPLGRGLLTGRFASQDDFAEGDIRKSLPYPRFSEENFPKVLKLVEKIREIGKRHDATPSQVALAWLLAQSDNVIPIPGTKNVKYLHENLGALSIKLTPEEVAEVRAAEAETHEIGRNPAGFEAFHSVDTPAPNA